MNEIIEFVRWMIESNPMVAPVAAVLIGIAFVFGWPNGLLITQNTEVERTWPDTVNINTFPKGRLRDAPLVDFSKLAKAPADSVTKLAAIALVLIAFFALLALAPAVAFLMACIGLLCAIFIYYTVKSERNVKE